MPRAVEHGDGRRACRCSSGRRRRAPASPGTDGPAVRDVAASCASRSRVAYAATPMPPQHAAQRRRPPCPTARVVPATSQAMPSAGQPAGERARVDDQHAVPRQVEGSSPAPTPMSEAGVHRRGDRPCSADSVLTSGANDEPSPGSRRSSPTAGWNAPARCRRRSGSSRWRPARRSTWRRCWSRPLAPTTPLSLKSRPPAHSAPLNDAVVEAGDDRPGLADRQLDSCWSPRATGRARPPCRPAAPG